MHNSSRSQELFALPNGYSDKARNALSEIDLRDPDPAFAKVSYASKLQRRSATEGREQAWPETDEILNQVQNNSRRVQDDSAGIVEGQVIERGTLDHVPVKANSRSSLRVGIT